MPTAKPPQARKSQISQISTTYSNRVDVLPIGPQKSMCQPQVNPKREGQVQLDEVQSEGEFEAKVETRRSSGFGL